MQLQPHTPTHHHGVMLDYYAQEQLSMCIH